MAAAIIFLYVISLWLENDSVDKLWPGTTCKIFWCHPWLEQNGNTIPYLSV